MAASNLDSADLKAVLAGGLINEDVMSQIWDISKIPLPFSDSIGSDSCKNSYAEWTTDELADPALGNAVVDGADSDQNDTATGLRVGNHCQEPIKEVRVSTRARSSDTIGRADELSYQVMRRQQELRRDVEVTFLSNQASVQDDGNTTAGLLGGFQTWLASNASYGATGTAGGFNTATKLTVAASAGTKRGLTETLVRDIAQQVYEEGGDPSILTSNPTVIRKLSEYMFTSSARIATLTGETNQKGPATAMGSVNVFLTDFGVTLKMVPNRLMLPQDGDGLTDADVYAAYIYDPQYVRASYLTGYRVEPLAKTGLSDKRLMHCDVTLKVLNEKAHGVIGDIDQTVDVVT